MKQTYLDQLKALLLGYELELSEVDDIVADYNDMYENYLDYGMSEEEVEEKLGQPKTIISSLTEGVKRKSKPAPKGQRFIALSPFISTIAFFIIGFGFNGWVYGWLAFLLIPVTAIIVNMRVEDPKNLTTALSPFVAVTAFFILGFFYNLWHPGWMVFLIIPVIAIFNNRDEMKFLELLTALSPFAATTVFLFLGFEGYWVPGWLVFLIIPAIGILNNKNKLQLVVSELLLILGVGAYLYIGYNFADMWAWAGLSFLPFVIYQIIIGNIQLFGGDVPKGYKIVVAVSALLYIAISFITGLWVITWLIFFAIPVYAIYRETSGSERIIAITPFIATALFMLLGYFLNLWAWSWIAFLIIPMTAILVDKDL